MSLSTSLTLSCTETNRAAIKRIFLSPTCDITSFTAGALQDFTAVTMDSTAKVWYEYEAEFQTKGLNGEGASENGTATFTNTVTFKVNGLDKTKLKRIQEVIDTGKITAIIESTNSTGTYNRAYVVGWDKVLEKDAYAVPNANYMIEPNLDGSNSIEVTLVAKHAELVREFVGSITDSGSNTVQFGS